MKKTDIQELKNKAPVELSRILSEEQEKLRGLKFELAAGKIKNAQTIRESKKKIARVLTFLQNVSKLA